MKLEDIYRADRLPARFWRKVDKSGECWIWTACRAAGYGYFGVHIGGRVVGTYAHRISYMLEYGEVPDDMDICHDCDVNYPVGDTSYRLCVNPHHLFAGSTSDNIRDAYAKGRRAPLSLKGNASPNRKLSEDAVRVIRERATRGESQAVLAREYGVALSTIGAALSRQNWAHVV